MYPSQYDLVIKQRSCFDEDVELCTENEDGTTTPFDLTGYAVKAQIRSNPTDDNVLVDNFASISDIGDYALGRITLHIPYATTLALFFDGFAWWDLWIEKDGERTPILEGKVSLSLGVTR